MHLMTSLATSVRKMAPQILVSSVSTPLPVEGPVLRPPGRTMTNGMPFSAHSAFSRSSAFTFSSSTGSSAAYTWGGGAPLESPVPMEVTSTNFGMRPCCSPLSAAASISAMLPSESARGSAGVPPMVDTTASYSSTRSKAFLTSLGISASPLERKAPIFSISGRLSSRRCSTVTQVPASLSWRTTSIATPLPPATSTEMLSGSRSARAALGDTKARIAGLRPARLPRRAEPLKESFDAVAHDMLTVKAAMVSID
mmetsp:Transcript_8923/g.22424  ORF Transcript_8923/g.22424 Transcript_8923/m.22424 type:complete len:254 (-) Transcript_8923:48-809(-)